MKRLIAVAIALMLVASGCGTRRGAKVAGPKSGAYGAQGLLVSPSPGASGASSSGGSTAAAGTKSTPKTSQATSGADPGGVEASQIVADVGGFGARNGRLFLGSSQYTTINFEIDSVVGREPSQAAIDHLVKVTREVAPGKKVTVNGGNVIAAQGGSYSGEGVRAIGERLRDVRSDKPIATVWVGYLDGTLKGGGAAGVAVGGTVCAVFMDTIDELPFPPTTRLGLEKAILVQEVFHLMGLVNIGYKSPRPHEDLDHPHHSNNQDSVMFWALMNRAHIVNFLARGGVPPTTFDADDTADLRDLAAGNL
ncbi:MAG: hypothetical protein ABIS18_02840 [Actinomycetota bacterium]